MKKVLLAAMALMVAMSFTSCESCNSEKQNAEQNAEAMVETVEDAAAKADEAIRTQISEWNAGLYGTYVASELPAADAAGFNSTLVLNADLTYTLEQKVIDHEDVFNESGKITEVKVADGVIVLTAEDGYTKQFKVIENGNLLFLTSDGAEPADELREAYTFVRQ